MPESGVSRAGQGISAVITISTLEGLTHVRDSADGRALPRLAESWTWEDSHRLRLKLRPGVTFHDGTALNAAVAAEAIQRAIAEPGYRSLYPSVSDITAVRPDGDLSLIFELSKPSAFLLEELDIPLAIGEGDIGTGPFRLARREGTQVVLQRFDQYYLGSPEIEQIVVRPFDTLRTAWASLLRGDVDVVNDVPPEAVDFIRNDDIQVIWYPRWFQFLIAFNSQRAPFTSSAVRRALNVAVDREALIANVLDGQGQTSTGPFWPRHWAYDASVPPYRFDPAFAATLLDSVGLRSGSAPQSSDLPPARLRFTCLLPADFALLERIGLEVQKQLYDIGVDMQFEVVSLQEWDERIREGRFEAVMVDMVSGPTLARANVFWGAGRRDGLHAFGYESPQATRLFEQLRTTTNEAAIRSALGRLQRVMLEDPPALFLAWNQRARAISSRFRLLGEPGSDPLFTIRQWTENRGSPPLSTP